MATDPTLGRPEIGFGVLVQVRSFRQNFCGFENPSLVQLARTKSMNPRSTLVATSVTRIR